MNRSIYSSSRNKKRIRSIHNDITLKGGDIAFDDLNIIPK
jgi:hypothetical protein